MEEVNIARIHDKALEYELDILDSAEEITTLRIHTAEHKDPQRLMYILPVLNCIIDEAYKYKEWINEQLEKIGQDGG